jgi:hypothetical protein
MTRILAIDPGTERSAYVVYDADTARVLAFSILPNAEIESLIGDPLRTAEIERPEHCVIEMVASYGMAVGREVFETVYWVGRFARAWDFWGSPLAERMYRREIKLHLCDSPRAKDANIRQALLDRYGGSDKIAKGTKHAKGPLYGFTSDVWAALAIAVTYAERDRQHRRETEPVPF